MHGSRFAACMEALVGAGNDLPDVRDSMSQAGGLPSGIRVRDDRPRTGTQGALQEVVAHGTMSPAKGGQAAGVVPALQVCQCGTTGALATYVGPLFKRGIDHTNRRKTSRLSSFESD